MVTLPRPEQTGCNASRFNVQARQLFIDGSLGIAQGEADEFR